MQRGTLRTSTSLRIAAAAAEGVIHLAFVHNFADFAASLNTDLRAVETMGSALAGTGKPSVTTAHLNGEASDTAVLALTGVRSVVVSLSPSVHDTDDKHGFIPQLIAIARAKGVSAYIGDGTNRWPAVHRRDAALLYRMALESAPAMSRLDGVGDTGVPFRDIAGVIGRGLNVPVVSIAHDAATAHFGPFLGVVVARDIPRSSDEPRRFWDGGRSTRPSRRHRTALRHPLRYISEAFRTCRRRAHAHCQNTGAGR